MRPHTIQNAQIPNPTLDKAERFRRFVRGIVRVPKIEVEKKINESGLAKGRAGSKKRGDHGDGQAI
jgi:hypothetical protein